MSKQNWIEIYKFHLLYVTFVTIKLNSLFQYFSSFNTSCSFLWNNYSIRFDGHLFWRSASEQKKAGKTPRKIRYDTYCSWALRLIEKTCRAHSRNKLHLPPKVLGYLKKVVPGDIVGEVRAYCHEVSLKEFSMALGTSSCQLHTHRNK